MGECFACCAPQTVGQCTLAFEETTLEQVDLCEKCLTDFQEIGWMDVMVAAE